MPKFQVNVTLILSNGQAGPNFNALVDALDYIAALDEIKPHLTLVLKEAALATPRFDAPDLPPISPPVPE